jgi:hypothetical protein
VLARVMTEPSSAVRADQLRRLLADESHRLERTSDACRALIDGVAESRPELAAPAEKWRREIALASREGIADLVIATEAAVGKYAAGELSEHEAVEQVEAYVLAVRHRMNAAQRVAAYGVYELEEHAPAIRSADAETTTATTAATAATTPAAATAAAAPARTPATRAPARPASTPSAPREGAPRRAAAALVAAFVASALVLGGVFAVSELTKDDGGGSSNEPVAGPVGDDGGAGNGNGNGNGAVDPPANDATPPPSVDGTPPDGGSSATAGQAGAPSAVGNVSLVTPPGETPIVVNTPPPTAAPPTVPPGTNPPPTLPETDGKPNGVCTLLSYVNLC